MVSGNSQRGICRHPQLSKTIALAPGEPAGVGLDLLVRLAQGRRNTPIIAFTDPLVLQDRAHALKVDLEIDDYDSKRGPECRAGILTVRPVPFHARVTPGKPSTDTAPDVIRSIKLATEFTMAGAAHALVTGPVHKSVISESGIAFRGHTELLAQISGTPEVVMLLVAGDLRVAIATRHLPLSQVPGAINSARLETSLRILDAGLRQRFGLEEPRILVAGLNPHAGEDGHFGREEINIIAPAVSRLSKQGLRVKGPMSADTLFTASMRAHADAIFAMYHDQGLAPLKALGFGEAVNVTLGLPFVRTSVDHGTALGLVGTGNADPGSLEAAIELAARLR